MERKVPFVEFPDVLPADASGRHRYVRSKSMCAISGDRAWTGEVVCSLDRPQITVYRDVPDEAEIAKLGSAITPVYQIDGRGDPAIPTGDILIRLKSSHKLDQYDRELDAVGYQLKSVLSYAPHAGWLQARSGKLRDALAGIERLAGLPDVEHVEPQMIKEMAKKLD